MQHVTVIGGGIAGLVAAIELAEAGRRVTLHEARGHLGGRGETTPGPHLANFGAHALYRHGALERWLRERGLFPDARSPKPSALRLLHRDRLRRVPLPLLPLLRHQHAEAPVELDYRTWARMRMGDRAAEAAVGFASLPTFHADPGTLSAAFVQERIRRSLAKQAVCYVIGGWQRLIDTLAHEAEAAGVRIELRSPWSERPDGPTVIATSLDRARALLRDDSLVWPQARTASFDVALRRSWRDPAGILDIDDRVYASRYSAVDPSLAPSGESLLQCVAGVREDEEPAAAHARIERVLDRGYRGWRDRITWKRHGFHAAGASPADPPGTCWRDRPAIERGDDCWLAGDSVAAPGVLSEVSLESARIAARSLLEKTGTG